MDSLMYGHKKMKADLINSLHLFTSTGDDTDNAIRIEAL